MSFKTSVTLIIALVRAMSCLVLALSILTICLLAAHRSLSFEVNFPQHSGVILRLDDSHTPYGRGRTPGAAIYHHTTRGINHGH